MTRSFALFVPLALTLSAGCGTAAVNMDAPRRVVGTENAVRVDAEIFGDQIRSGMQVPITVEITNERSTPIAIADLVAATTFDTETRTVTVDLGSEVPGNELLPRLIPIAPGETKTMTTAARIGFEAGRGAVGTGAARPVNLRIKVNFLGGDLEPFSDLLSMKEKGLVDPARADALFPLWLEQNEVVYTNAVPMRWRGRGDAQSAPVERLPVPIGVGRR